MKQRLTNKQLSVYCFSQDYFKENDQIPTADAVTIHIGAKDRTAGYHHLRQLERKGYLERNAAGWFRFTRERIE